MAGAPSPGKDRDAQVVVGGAGPAGLFAAVTLDRQGVRVLLRDKRATVSPPPRAVGISLRQMDLLRAWGLKAAVRAGGADPAISTMVGLGGSNGEPRNGTVEIGYSVAPEHRSRGHATGRSRAAHAARPTPESSMSSRKHLARSTHPRVSLERCGLRRTATLPDPGLGMIRRRHRYPGADTDTPPNPRSNGRAEKEIHQ